MIYFGIFIWFAIMAFVVNSGRFRKNELVCGEMQLRLPMQMAILIFLPIVLIAGLRDNIFDTSAYVKSFINMPDTFVGLWEYMKVVPEDRGFYFLSGIIKVIGIEGKTVYLLIIAMIQGICIMSVFRKYSPNYLMTVFLFVVSTDYISWMCNGIRQFLAVTIIFAATGLMLKKKYVSLTLVILFASTIHLSALIMLPIVFIAHGKPWNKKTITFIVIMLLVVFFANQFTDFLDVALNDTQYSNAVGHWQSINDEGTSFLRVAIYSIPALLSLVGRRKFEYKNNIVFNLCINMSIISMGLYILSMFTSGIYIGRLPIYCSLYGYILLPQTIKEIFEPRSARFVSITMVLAYLLFYYFQVHIVWGIA